VADPRKRIRRVARFPEVPSKSRLFPHAVRDLRAKKYVATLRRRQQGRRDEPRLGGLKKIFHSEGQGMPPLPNRKKIGKMKVEEQVETGRS